MQATPTVMWHGMAGATNQCKEEDGNDDDDAT